MAELVDATDLKSGTFGCVGSTPTSPTYNERSKMNGLVLSLQEWLDLYDALVIASDDCPLPHVEKRYRDLMNQIDEYLHSEFQDD